MPNTMGYIGWPRPAAAEGCAIFALTEDVEFSDLTSGETIPGAWVHVSGSTPGVTPDPSPPDGGIAILDSDTCFHFTFAPVGWSIASGVIYAAVGGMGLDTIWNSGGAVDLDFEGGEGSAGGYLTLVVDTVESDTGTLGAGSLVTICACED